MTPQAMIELFQKHVNAELAGDLETTPATMSDVRTSNMCRRWLEVWGVTACGRFIAIILSAGFFRRM